MAVPPGSLQIGTSRDGTPSFVTQGQVDWIAFGSTIWQVSSAVLQRFASAGVQPVTLGATLAIANNFELDRLGRQRVEQSLASLRYEHGFDRVLFFGFGYRSFVRILAETELGINIIALCCCLSQSHVVELSAAVLGEIWQELGYPAQYKPSHHQFVLLVETCAGTLATSTFDDTVNLMLGAKFRPNSDIDSDDEDGRSLDADESGRPHTRAARAPEIAKVLHSLFRLSTKKVEQITVVGGVECAFAAAFAHWALRLQIQVKDVEGDLIFTSVLDDSKAQVIFRYLSDPTKPSMELTGVVHHLNTPTNIFVHTDGPGLELIIRVPWSQCLRRTFGSSFDELIKPFHLLSSYVGSGARIYKAIATGEAYEGELKDCLSRTGFDTFVETSYGQGLVHTMVNTFPEIAVPNFLEKMRRAADASITDAIKAATLASQSLSQLCRCQMCRPGNNSDHSPYCLPQLANTIFHLAVQLGCATWDTGLRPAVAGLLAFYHAFSSEAMVTDIKGHEFISFGTLPVESGLHNISNPLNDISVIFDGQSTPFLDADGPQPTAFSRNGICYFIEALQHLSSKADIVRRVHVLPGHIQHGDRRYDTIQDGESWFSNIPDAESQPWDSLVFPEPLATGNMEVKAMILERDKGLTLQFYYRVTSEEFTAMLQPGRSTRKVLAGTRSLTCLRNANCPQQLSGRCVAIRSGWRPQPEQTQQSSSQTPMRNRMPREKAPATSNSGSMFHIWSFDTDIARLVALETHKRQQPVYSKRHREDEWAQTGCYLRRDECLACCIRSIHMLGNSETVHIL